MLDKKRGRTSEAQPMDEFRVGLELSSDEELHGLTTLLFSKRFNPLDYLMGLDPQQASACDRQTWLTRLDHRFRFLAADGVTVLKQRSRHLPYRTILRQVCQHLNLDCDHTGPTLVLEELIFLHLLDVAYEKLPPSQQRSLERYFQESLQRAPWSHRLQPSTRQSSLKLLLGGGTALMLSSVVRPLILKQIAKQVTWHMARYQLARQTVATGSGLAAGAVQTQMAVQMARRGVALNVARYGAARSVFAVVGPALWTWFLADLGWRAIATNYGRVLPVIFTMAQIRLLRAETDSPAHDLSSSREIL